MILVIDTSVPRFLLGVVDSSRVIKKSTGPFSSKLSAALWPALRSFAKYFPKIQRIVAVTGPGSYTGLRVGLTAANALAYGLNVPVAGVSRFAAYQKKGRPAGSVILDNLRDLVYWGRGQRTRVLALDKLAAAGPYYGNLAPEKSSVLKKRGIIYHSIKWTDDEWLVTVAGQVRPPKSRKFKKAVLPLYIQPPHITKGKSKLRLKR